MKRFEMPGAAGMILLSCRRIVEQGCAAQLLPPDRYSQKRKNFLTGGFVSIMTYVKVEWHWKQLPDAANPHRKLILYYACVNWIGIFLPYIISLAVSPGFCLVLEPFPYWNRRTGQLLLFGSSTGLAYIGQASANCNEEEIETDNDIVVTRIVFTTK